MKEDTMKTGLICGAISTCMCCISIIFVSIAVLLVSIDLENNSNRETYIQGFCLINSIDVQESTCTEEICTNNGRKVCFDETYICYKGHWDVSVFAFEDYDNETKVFLDDDYVRSRIDTDVTHRIRKKQREWMIDQHGPEGSVGSCYHLNSDRKDVKWEDEDHQLLSTASIVFMVLSVVGCSFAVPSLLVCAALIINAFVVDDY